MFKIAIANNKGGVGKTTSAFNMASYYAKKNFKVLVIDMDSQGNLSDCFISPENINETLYDSFKNKNIKNSIHIIDDSLHIVPADADLERCNFDFVSEIGRETLLKRLLLSVENDYDLCIIDTSPAISLLTLNALSAVDKVYIPLGSGLFEIKGVQLLNEAIENIKNSVNFNLEIGGIFVTNHLATTNLAKNVLDYANNIFENKMLNTVIRRNIQLAESISFKESIFTYKPNSTGADDYASLCEEILSREVITLG